MRRAYWILVWHELACAMWSKITVFIRKVHTGTIGMPTFYYYYSVGKSNGKRQMGKRQQQLPISISIGECCCCCGRALFFVSLFFASIVNFNLLAYVLLICRPFSLSASGSCADFAFIDIFKVVCKHLNNNRQPASQPGKQAQRAIILGLFMLMVCSFYCCCLPACHDAKQKSTCMRNAHIRTMSADPS